MASFPTKKIIIGDIHGQLGMLAALLEYHGPDNHYIFLGDYVDRGSGVRAVLDTILQLPHKTTLLGNHEELLIKILKGPDKIKGYTRDRQEYEMNSWLAPVNGGLKTLQSFGLNRDSNWGDLDLKYQNFFESLVLYHEDDEAVYVHAGLDPDLPMSKQKSDRLLWVRESWIFKLRPYNGKKVFFGHTISKYFPGFCNSQGIIYHNNCIGLDTGAYQTGILSSIVLQKGAEMQLVQYQDSLKQVVDCGRLLPI